MGNWMENVQAYSGFPQESIDLLIEMEYQGNLNDPEMQLILIFQMPLLLSAYGEWKQE